MEWLRRVLGVTTDGSDTTSEVAGRDEVAGQGDEEAGRDGVADRDGGNHVRATRETSAEGTTDATEADRSESSERTDGATTARPRGQPHPPGSVPQGVALFVDGPNVLRDEFDVDLDDVRAAAGDAGPLVATRLYLDEHAPPGLIQAAEARGYRVITTSGDVDVRLAVDVARFAAEGRAATVAVASRDTDFKPAVEAANEYGLATLAIAPGSYGRSDALRNAVDRGITLSEVTGDGE